MIDLASMVAAIQKETGSFFATEAHPDPYRYINSAVNYIYNRRDWQWNRKVYTFSYSSAGAEQTLPFYAQKIFYVKLNGELLGIMNSEDWFQTDDHSGYVGLFGDKFISDSNGTYRVLYSNVAPSVSATSEGIDLPPFYYDVVQSVAMHYAYKDIKDYATAGAIIAQANAILDNVTDRTSNIKPRQETRLGSNYSF